MTDKLFLEHGYETEFEAEVIGFDEQAVILDKTLFYATSGGQPGDCGYLRTSSNDNLEITVANKSEDNENVLHILSGACPTLKVGDKITGKIDWELRHKHMRMHSCLHLLCASVVGDVTGGSIGAEKSRLDFNIPGDAVDKVELTEKLNKLIEEDHPIKSFWITEEELAEKPHLVRTMSVKPPSAQGKVRLIQIGTDDHIIDLQPCGGTHVKSTGEIGKILVRKIENKGRQNRRINIVFDEE